MRRCIDSLLPHREVVEIIIIDDGSTDETGPIADAYAENNASFVRVIHQPNGGHGAGINRGLQEAQGLFFKVVDADDWMEMKSTALLLETIASFATGTAMPDVLICNYARIRQKDGHVHTVRYRNVFRPGKILVWDEVGRIGQYQNLMMHALFYNTTFLKRWFSPLPEHSYYVDCLFSFQPLFHARTLFYLDTTPYQYLLGQPNQSVNKHVVIRNIDQMLLICDTMAKAYADHYRAMPARQQQLLGKAVAAVATIVSAHLMLDASPEAWKKKRRLWAGFKAMDRSVYQQMQRHPAGILASIDHPAMHRITTLLYHIVSTLLVLE